LEGATEEEEGTTENEGAVTLEADSGKEWFAELHA
jgi:hypothetical protein